MACPACGAANEDGRKFCGECGARLSAPCPACGTPNAPATKFCGECGASLSSTAAPAAPAVTERGVVPSTERRLVSVLFADLVGFTTISEQRDAEDVRELLGRYFERSREIIERYGGTVEKFIGDAVMAVWGTPTAQEDDAERAVRAALDLVDAISALGAERGVDNLALRGGVHTGEAVVTIGASGMGMVAGDLVNTAARLQSVAEPGTVLVGEGTRRAADTAIVFEEAGAQTLKGKELPVAAFRALRVVAQRGGVGRAEGLEPPFVGREAELRLIKDFYHATARERGPRLVSVIGQAGIGKSRLAWEFLKYIDGVTEVVYWHQGRSPAYGDGISFWALGEMVRMRIGIGEAAPEDEVRERVAATLEEFVADPDERRTLAGPLLHLVGAGEGSHDRATLFLAWRTFFERIAEHAPVVMVFEDLQWADDGLLEFIEEMLTWSRGRSIYLISLARLELLDRRPTWGAGHRSFTSLSLAPLAADEMRALLAGLVPGLGDEAIGRIVDRAEGIPLYAVETIRTLLNDGSIERDGEAFRVVREVGDLSVPESLQALIAARIDALPAVERTLVQDAAVLGQSFPDAAVRAVTRLDGADVDRLLGNLVQREILVREDDPRSPERGFLRFVQGLLREVAYGTLARDDRRSRHLAAARYYEALGDDELSGVLAQHYVDAYAAHPDGAEGQAVGAQARVALRGAAARAAALASPRRAHSYLVSALGIPTEPAEELELRQLAADEATDAGMVDDAVAHWERALLLAEQLDLPEQRRRITAGFANMLVEGQQSRAKELLSAALAEPGLEPTSPGWVQLATVAAKVEMRTRNSETAIELADRALAQAAAAGLEEELLDVLITKGVALVNTRRVTEAVVILTGALDVAQRRNDRGGINRAAVNLGYAISTDDPMRAYEISRQLLADALRGGVVWEVRYLLGNAVDGAVDVGDWDWAEQAMAEHESLFAEPLERLWFDTYLTVIAAFRGGDVRDRARELLELGHGFDDLQVQGLGEYAMLIVHWLDGNIAALAEILDENEQREGGAESTAYALAHAALWAGDIERARRARAVLDRDAQPGKRTSAMILATDAGIAALEGRHADARTMFTQALDALREIHLNLWLGITELDAIVLGAMEPDERRAAAAEARELFTRLRAEALIDRLDAALANRPPDRRSPPAPSEPATHRDAAEVPSEA